MKIVYDEMLTKRSADFANFNEQNILQVTVKYSASESLAMIKFNHDRWDTFVGEAKTDEKSEVIYIFDREKFLEVFPAFSSTIFMENQKDPYGAIREAVLMVENVRPVIMDYIRKATEEETEEHYA